MGVETMAMVVISALAIIAVFFGWRLHETELELDDALDEIDYLRREIKHEKWSVIDRDFF